jgi:hypothetical protein
MVGSAEVLGVPSMPLSRRGFAFQVWQAATEEKHRLKAKIMGRSDGRAV